MHKVAWITMAWVLVGCGGSYGFKPDKPLARNCPRSIGASDDLRGMFELLRCPETRFSGEVARARDVVRPYVDNQIGPDREEWPRATYVHLCRRELTAENADKPYPSITLNCLYRAHMLDPAALKADLEKLDPADRAVVAERSASDVAELERIANAAFPRAEHAREWEIFHDLPLRVRDQQREREKTHASAYAAMAEFAATFEKGDWSGCEVKLRRELQAYVGAAEPTLAGATERMTDPLGYALADSLARCDYYAERLMRTAATLTVLDKGSRRVTLAEQITGAQLEAVHGDQPGAEKFPQLVGKKYTSVPLSYLAPAAPYPDDLEEAWRRDREKIAGFQKIEGRITKIQKTADGAVISFAKERVPDTEFQCRETNKVDRIGSDGRVVYREECTSKTTGWSWSALDPITIDDARGLAPGRFVRLVSKGDAIAVLSCTQGNPEKPGRLYRLADVIFE